jgi:acid stress chaperone HdeB
MKSQSPLPTLSNLVGMLLRTLPAGFIAPCLPIETTKLFPAPNGCTRLSARRVLQQQKGAVGSRAVACAGLTRLSGNGVCSASKKEQIMSPKPIVTGVVFSSIVFATASTQAQVIVDVSKITCDQYVHAKIATPMYLAAWLSGYYNAKRNNRIIDLQTLEENVSKLQNYCYDEKNFKVPVMKAVEQVLSGRK